MEMLREALGVWHRSWLSRRVGEDNVGYQDIPRKVY